MPAQENGRQTGIARFGFRLAAALAHRGAVDVVLRTAWPRSELPRELSELEITPVRYNPVDVASSIFQAASIPQLCKSLDIDLLLNVDPLGSPRAGRPIATIVHDLYTHTLPHKYPRRVRFTSQRIVSHMVKNSDRLIAISNTTKADLINYYPSAELKTTVVLSDSTLAATCPSPPTVMERPFFLAVGNATENKNFDLLVDAFRLLVAKRGHVVDLVHVGADPRRVFKLTDNVCRPFRFAGIDDARLSALYRGALALVVPSLYEGFCLPIVEAQKLGCPVLFSDRSATAEIGGTGGLSFNPCDPVALAKLMQRLLDEPLLRTELAAQGARNAERFSWPNAAEAYERIMLEMLDRSVSTPLR